jgi:hypothetical protein
MRQRAERGFLPLQEIADRHIDELYYRFQHNKITERDLQRGLSVFIAHKKTRRSSVVIKLIEIFFLL